MTWLCLFHKFLGPPQILDKYFSLPLISDKCLGLPRQMFFPISRCYPFVASDAHHLPLHTSFVAAPMLCISQSRKTLFPDLVRTSINWEFILNLFPFLLPCYIPFVPKSLCSCSFWFTIEIHNVLHLKLTTKKYVFRKPR